MSGYTVHSVDVREWFAAEMSPRCDDLLEKIARAKRRDEDAFKRILDAPLLRYSGEEWDRRVCEFISEGLSLWDTVYCQYAIEVEASHDGADWGLWP